MDLLTPLAVDTTHVPSPNDPGDEPVGEEAADEEPPSGKKPPRLSIELAQLHKGWLSLREEAADVNGGEAPA